MLYSNARYDQLGDIARIFREIFKHTYPSFPNLHTLDEDLNYFENVIYKKDSIVIAVESDNIVGFIAFNSEFIDHLYVLPTVQHRGVGTALLKIAQQEYDHLKLWTFQENRKARAFYEKHKFLPIKFTDGENEEGQPDVLYEYKYEQSSA